VGDVKEVRQALAGQREGDHQVKPEKTQVNQVLAG
jgi:hypothetical protein